MSETKQAASPAVLRGEGDTKIIRRTRVRIPCDTCGEPADARHTYLLPNARGNPASSAYGKDDCSWCSDHETFTCEECRWRRFGGRSPRVDGYLECSTFRISDRFAHMFLTWQEEEIPEMPNAAAPGLLAALIELVNPDDFDQHPDDFASEWHRARAALAKATGAAP